MRFLNERKYVISHRCQLTVLLTLLYIITKTRSTLRLSIRPISLYSEPNEPQLINSVEHLKKIFKNATGCRKKKSKPIGKIGSKVKIEDQIIHLH